MRRSDHAPVVTASDFTAAHGQNIAASALFSVTDADNDTIAKYQFWDSTADPASGHWVVGGVAQGTNTAIDVTAAQLASTTFQSGSGSDDLWVRANDGVTWGAWKEFHVNAPMDNAPVVTASDFTATHGQNIAAGSLFSVTDADNRQYRKVSGLGFDGRSRERALGGGWGCAGDQGRHRRNCGATGEHHVPERLWLG